MTKRHHIWDHKGTAFSNVAPKIINKKTKLFTKAELQGQNSRTQKHYGFKVMWKLTFLLPSSHNFASLAPNDGPKSQPVMDFEQLLQYERIGFIRKDVMYRKGKEKSGFYEGREGLGWKKKSNLGFLGFLFKN